MRPEAVLATDNVRTSHRDRSAQPEGHSRPESQGLLLGPRSGLPDGVRLPGNLSNRTIGSALASGPVQRAAAVQPGATQRAAQRATSGSAARAAMPGATTLQRAPSDDLDAGVPADQPLAGAPAQDTASAEPAQAEPAPDEPAGKGADQTGAHGAPSWGGPTQPATPPAAPGAGQTTPTAGASSTVGASGFTGTGGSPGPAGRTATDQATNEAAGAMGAGGVLNTGGAPGIGLAHGGEGVHDPAAAGAAGAALLAPIEGRSGGLAGAGGSGQVGVGPGDLEDAEISLVDRFDFAFGFGKGLVTGVSISWATAAAARAALPKVILALLAMLGIASTPGRLALVGGVVTVGTLSLVVGQAVFRDLKERRELFVTVNGRQPTSDETSEMVVRAVSNIFGIAYGFEGVFGRRFEGGPRIGWQDRGERIGLMVAQWVSLFLLTTPGKKFMERVSKNATSGAVSAGRSGRRALGKLGGGRKADGAPPSGRVSEGRMAESRPSPAPDTAPDPQPGQRLEPGAPTSDTPPPMALPGSSLTVHDPVPTTPRPGQVFGPPTAGEAARAAAAGTEASAGPVTRIPVTGREGATKIPVTRPNELPMGGAEEFGPDGNPITRPSNPGPPQEVIIPWYRQRPRAEETQALSLLVREALDLHRNQVAPFANVPELSRKVQVAIREALSLDGQSPTFKRELRLATQNVEKALDRLRNRIDRLRSSQRQGPWYEKALAQAKYVNSVREQVLAVGRQPFKATHDVLLAELGLDTEKAAKVIAVSRTTWILADVAEAAEPGAISAALSRMLATANRLREVFRPERQWADGRWYMGGNADTSDLGRVLRGLDTDRFPTPTQNNVNMRVYMKAEDVAKMVDRSGELPFDLGTQITDDAGQTSRTLLFRDPGANPGVDQTVRVYLHDSPLE